MFSKLYPKEEWASAYEPEYDRLYRQGFRGIIFDIDNTLVEHGAPTDEKAILLIRKLTQKGFKVCFLSNNKEPRVKSFCKSLGTPYFFKAGKPKGNGYLEVQKLLHLPKEQLVSIGDQIFTDTLGANLAGVYSVLVGQIGKKEEIQIVLKRYLEKIVLALYHRKRKREKSLDIKK